MQYGSWAGACDNKIAGSVLVCGSVYRGVHVRESVPQCGPRPPGLCTSVYVCTVRTPKGFMQCASARPPGLCTSVYFSTVRAQTGFVGCEPARALYSVMVLVHQSLKPNAYVLGRICTVCARKCLCFFKRYEPQELCAVRAYKGFIKCAGARPPGLCTPCLCARAVV